MELNADGGSEIYVATSKSEGVPEENWLPLPTKGVLGGTMRLYAPKAQALAGRWNPPAIKKVKKV